MKCFSINSLVANLCRLLMSLFLFGTGLGFTASVAFADEIAPPVFSPAGCEFYNPIAVEISAPEGCEIYYTTGSENPTVSEESRYKAPVVISATTTLKAIAVDASGDASTMTVATYTCTRYGIGQGYHPDSPGDPSVAELTHTLTVVTNPSCAGSSESYRLKAGEEAYVRSRSNTGFQFQNWTIEGEVVSDASSFYYVMPDYDVTIVGNYIYRPSGPGDPSPEEQKLTHPVVVRAIPSCAASFSPSDEFGMEENSSRWIYAYPNTGWKLTGWTVNGVKIDSMESYIEVSMQQSALDVAASFSYSPEPPANPAANYFNPSTGLAIVDDFAPGRLYDAVSNLVGGSFQNISHLIVKGR